MNDTEDALDDTPEVADENVPTELDESDNSSPKQLKSRFAELLKAIEHWVQTR